MAGKEITINLRIEGTERIDRATEKAAQLVGLLKEAQGLIMAIGGGGEIGSGSAEFLLKMAMAFERGLTSSPTHDSGARSRGQ